MDISCIHRFGHAKHASQFEYQKIYIVIATVGCCPPTAPKKIYPHTNGWCCEGTAPYVKAFTY
jgi:hypothetical protein